MSKLGSEFLKEFDQFERPIMFGRTKRQLIFYMGVVLAVLVSGLLYYFKFPLFIVYLLLAVITVPIFIYGAGKDEEMRERWRFRYTIQERAYMTDFPPGEQRLTKKDFMRQQKGVNEFETDQGRETT
ncbi:MULTISPECIES: PrgI family mobile element protein [Streptococcus]|uniref:PrgI family mobile element protein n=1 Tax=Streptococcus TaxID=1301 RepID=UPI0005CD7FF5|nr:PrgI family protein [Streptococcus suis]MDW8750555.1 PrgI family protein [Streptococcus suis]NQH64073.1 PrgI family protein [Streptococcus suis]CYU83262.1 PrgI family protein [Streptococcus suis]HEL1605648.1 PrgI family protein [Streptococcus suis]HEM4583751.1 PrgI family protein [Streptococcus suis]